MDAAEVYSGSEDIEVNVNSMYLYGYNGEIEGKMYFQMISGKNKLIGNGYVYYENMALSSMTINPNKKRSFRINGWQKNGEFIHQ